MCFDTSYLYHIGVIELVSLRGVRGQGCASKRAWAALWALISSLLETLTLIVALDSLVGSQRRPSLPNSSYSASVKEEHGHFWC